MYSNLIYERLLPIAVKTVRSTRSRCRNCRWIWMDDNQNNRQAADQGGDQGPACSFGPLVEANTDGADDLNLRLMLIRPANSFTMNNSEEVVMRYENLLTAGRYGLARRVYIMVEDDRAIPVGF